MNENLLGIAAVCSLVPVLDIFYSFYFEDGLQS